MEPFGWPCLLLGFSSATTMALRGVRRKSLSTSGAVAAWFVGFLSVASGLRGYVLVAFYLVGTKATKFHAKEKERLDASAHTGSVRGASQVLASSALAVTCCLVHAWYCGEERAVGFDPDPLASSLTCAVLAHHATCLGDTLASEMGILARQRPILITKPWQRVPPGTNGGITVRGTLWSGLGGALMGACTVCMDWISGIRPLQPLYMVWFGTACGLLGSLVDSVLGATLQASYWDPETKLSYQANDKDLPKSAKHISGINLLSNAQVNLVSVALTITISGWVLGPIVFSHIDKETSLQTI